MKAFKVIFINAGNGDPLSTKEYPYGTQFVAGDFIDTPDGQAVIDNIAVDEDYNCLLAIEVYYQHETLSNMPN